MAQYIMTYLGGDKPATQEEGQAHFAKYQKWLAELGDAVVSPANPIKDTHLIGPDGEARAQSSTGMSGYTILEAGSLEQALDMAKGCPFLELNGSLEVSELMQMSM